MCINSINILPLCQVKLLYISLEKLQQNKTSVSYQKQGEHPKIFWCGEIIIHLLSNRGIPSIHKDKGKTLNYHNLD